MQLLSFYSSIYCIVLTLAIGMYHPSPARTRVASWLAVLYNVGMRSIYMDGPRLPCAVCVNTLYIEIWDEVKHRMARR